MNFGLRPILGPSGLRPRPFGPPPTVLGFAQAGLRPSTPTIISSCWGLAAPKPPPFFIKIDMPGLRPGVLASIPRQGFASPSAPASSGFASATYVHISRRSRGHRRLAPPPKGGVARLLFPRLRLEGGAPPPLLMLRINSPPKGASPPSAFGLTPISLGFTSHSSRRSLAPPSFGSTQLR